MEITVSVKEIHDGAYRLTVHDGVLCKYQILILREWGNPLASRVALRVISKGIKDLYDGEVFLM